MKKPSELTDFDKLVVTFPPNEDGTPAPLYAEFQRDYGFLILSFHVVGKTHQAIPTIPFGNFGFPSEPTEAMADGILANWVDPSTWESWSNKTVKVEHVG